MYDEILGNLNKEDLLSDKEIGKDAIETMPDEQSNEIRWIIITQQSNILKSLTFQPIKGWNQADTQVKEKKVLYLPESLQERG